MKAIMNSKGQASIEALFSLVAAIAFFGSLIAIIYCCYIRDQLYFTSHEALICREFQNSNKCDRHFRKQLDSLLVFGNVENLQIYRSAKKQKLDLTISLEVFGTMGLSHKFLWKFSNSIDLPLREN